MPDNEEVARARLGHLAVLTKQPKNLVEAQRLRLAVRLQGGPVVGAELGPAEAARPGADSVWGGREESQALRGIRLAFLLHLGEVGPGHGHDEEEGFLGHLDAQVRAIADDGRADVEERAGAFLREPSCIVSVFPVETMNNGRSNSEHTGTVNLHQFRHQLLQFIVFERGQRGPLRTGVQPLAIAVWPKQAQLAVVAAVHLHALEALGGIVQARRRRRDAEILVRLHFGSFPAVVDGPSHGDHVVGAVGVAQLLGRPGQGHSPQVSGAGDVEGRGIELGHVGCDRAHVGIQ